MRAGELLDLDRVWIDAELARRVPAALATRRGLLLFARQGDELYVACRDAADTEAIEAVERAARGRVVPLPAEEESLRRALARVFPNREAGEDAVHVVDRLLLDAVAEQASDIHLEPSRDGLRIRFRVDGVLEMRRTLGPERIPSLLNRIKVLADLDIAERRVPQDGRFTFSYGSGTERREVDVRVAVLPVRRGERVTLRLLALEAEALTLPRLGLRDEDFDAFARAIRASHGMILLTGPTGSGKTTTLYAALREIDTARTCVLTIEDPVEYEIAGVSQTEVDTGERVTFAKALRAALRHDPDVLMVGEIRDLETADVAVKASLTGHLLLSTLHTNSAVSAVTRLVDMGVPPYLVAATARLFVAQRLVRRLCSHCMRSRPLTATEASALGAPDLAGREGFVAGGCAFCRGSGFAGRLGLFELFAPDEDARAAIAAGRPETELVHMAREKGMRTLREDAAAKVLAGLTSAGEAIRAVEATT